MKGNRVFRVIFALIVFAIFCYYSYTHFSGGFFSMEMDQWGEATGLKPEEFTGVEMNGAVPDEQPAETETPVETEPPAEEEPLSGLPQVDLTSWELVLVNANTPLGEDYAPPEVATVSESQCPMDSRVAEALQAFADGAKAEGLPVYLSSGYRAYSEQAYLYNRKISQGYSAEDAAKIVAPPGTSEHQTGLCCDITDYYRETKSWQELETTETFQWLNAHCHEYGFVLRYPKDKSGLDTAAAAESVTGIIYEPWHFRYVGVEVATYMVENNLCLEEFVALYNEQA